MKTRHGNLLHAFRAALAFLDTHAGTLDAAATCGSRKRLDTVLEHMAADALTQNRTTLAARFATQRIHVLRKELVYGHMVLVSRIAALHLPRKSMALRACRLPDGDVGIKAVHAAAMAMAMEAQAHVDSFTAAGLPRGFIVQLRVAANAMLAQFEERAQHQRAGKAATKSIKASLPFAQLMMRVLDALVRRELKDNPQLLAEWDAVKRVPRKAVEEAPKVPGRPVPALLKNDRRAAA